MGFWGSDKKKILIIEDSNTIVAVVKMYLKKQNYNVISAKNGKVGIEKIKKEKPELILLDINMPIMGGYQMLDYASQHRDIYMPPTIMMTSVNSKESVQRALTYPSVVDYIIKPFTQEGLFLKIERYIG